MEKERVEGLNAAGANADAVERVAAAKSAKNFMVSIGIFFNG